MKCVFHLQVLYYCPGFREGVKNLYDLSKRPEKPKDETAKNEEVGSKQTVKKYIFRILHHLSGF